MANPSFMLSSLDNLRVHRTEILALAEKHKASNVRIFGSVARQEATPASDIDIIATFRNDSSIFDLVGFWQDLQDLLGCEVDLIADHPDGV
jgi:hypothetical protein